MILLPAGVVASAQEPRDTAIKKPLTDSLAAKDTIPPVALDSLNYDELFSEMESFLDSITAPRSYTLAAIALGKGFFNYKTKDDLSIESQKKMTFIPTIGYYNKDGLGITTEASFLSDQGNLTYYQMAISPSYDYLKNRKLATGISYTRYLTKDSLPFYTSPLQNEIYGYFTYRKWWVKPMVAVSYGWGSRSEYQERETYITTLQLRRSGFTRVNTNESVSDFSVIASVRHDFYWLGVWGNKNYVRFTPQLTYTSGSQKFGFNQSSNTYATAPRTNSTVLYSTENVFLDNKMYFQPVSLALQLRAEYAISKFYIQPLLTLDYYFPAENKRFSSFFTLNAGVIF
jgi:hypothetical protein